MNVRHVARAVDVDQLSPQDLDAVTLTHLHAFQGYMNTKLGAGYLQRFYRWFLEQPDSICLRATVDGHFAGFVVGAPTADGSRRNRYLLSTVARSLLLRPHVWFDKRIRAAVLGRLRQQSSPQTVSSHTGFALVSIAVAPSHRRLGVAAALLEVFERHAKERGHSLLELSVYDHNQGAIRLYEQAGWLRITQSASLVAYEKRILC